MTILWIYVFHFFSVYREIFCLFIDKQNVLSRGVGMLILLSSIKYFSIYFLEFCWRLILTAKLRMGGRLTTCTPTRFQGLRQGASRSVEVKIFNFIWWVAFVLDGVLSDRSNTTSQIVEQSCPNLFNVIPGLRRGVTWDQYSSFCILTHHWTSLKMWVCWDTLTI
jgi:hypothetical protein